jgi:hypothetical protein
VYDMYSWDQATPAGGGGQTPERRPRPADKPSTSRPNGAARPAGHQARAAQAVQVALDRRDNGGDPAGAADQ